MFEAKTIEQLQQKMKEEADKPENWIEAGDIIVPSGKFVHVYWNVINCQIAIEYEKKEDGGGRKMILQRAGSVITANSIELARTEADEFYNPGHYR